LYSPEKKTLERYEQDFESYFLQETDSFYKKEARIWRGLTTYEYVLKALEFLQKEEDNAETLYEETTKPKLLEVFYRNVITEQHHDLCAQDTGCRIMFEEHRLQELKSMYTLFSRVESTL
jgi:hypothetical protein